MNRPRRFVLMIALLWAALGVVSLVRWHAAEFRPWEQLYDPATFRFVPSRRVVMHEIGDLGYKSWNRALQAPRETTFTTDRFGYRNAREMSAPEIVVIGDSFVAGSGLSDGETVAARLAERLGKPVYSFAAENLNAPALFLREERFQQQRPKIVIWAPVARGIAARPLFFEGSPDAPARWLDRVREPLERTGAQLARAVERLDRDNGLVREARFALQSLLGRFRDDPRTRRLPSGETVLALGLAEQSLLLTPGQRQVDHCIQMVTIFAGILQRAGVRFVFSPIPESGTIYPELFAASERAALPKSSFLDELIAGARAQAVEVIDLRKPYRSASRGYLYQLDDSHWNAAATELAAQAWAAELAHAPRTSDLAIRR